MSFNWKAALHMFALMSLAILAVLILTFLTMAFAKSLGLVWGLVIVVVSTIIGFSLYEGFNRGN